MRHDLYAWNPEPALEYRWRCGVRVGLWYPDYEAAGNAAVKQGLASWSGKVLFTGPLVEIETRPAAPTKKGAGSLRRPSCVSRGTAISRRRASARR